MNATQVEKQALNSRNVLDQKSFNDYRGTTSY